MWNKGYRPSKLGLHFFLKAAAAALFSIALYVLLVEAADYYVNRMDIDRELYQSVIDETTVDFQTYVTEHELSSQDSDLIYQWDRRQKLVHIWLIKDNQIIYDSLSYLSQNLPKNLFTKSISNIGYTPVTIRFTDGPAYLSVNILYRKRIEDRLEFAIAVLCILLFSSYIFREFGKLVKAVLRIEKGIHILESGDLTYQIDIHRDDELADLVGSINRMSQELDTKRRSEELMQQKNYSLVTSISHDIRTPLTSIISYVDLMLSPNPIPAKDQTRYLEKIREKSSLIRDLTDNLFTHFVNKSTEYELHYEWITGNDFLLYLLSNLKEVLRDQGYEVEISIDIQDEFFLKVDAIQIIRVFNNLEGNLLKYADNTVPIQYHACLCDTKLVIKGINMVSEHPDPESYGVGIRTCQEILELHHGSLNAHLDGDSYQLTLTLPVAYHLEAY